MSQSNRSHPPSLKTIIQSALTQNSIGPQNHLLIGVSGGSDSMALMAVLSHLQKQFKYKLTAIGINHNLREEAADELNIAENYAKSINVDFHKKDVFLEGSNIQEKARDARYEAIRSFKDSIGADLIVTAHHANDRAETVLMRMITGTKAQCMGVLPVRSFDLFRPMISANKSQVTRHIERFKIPYSEDPSNAKVEKYLRSKIRFEVLPELEKINPNIINTLCSIAESLC